MIPRSTINDGSTFFVVDYDIVSTRNAYQIGSLGATNLRAMATALAAD